MAKKPVNITLFKVGKGYQITIEPWAVLVEAVAGKNPDSIAWTSTASASLDIKEVVVDFKGKQHFKNTPKKITGRVNPATGDIRNDIDQRKYTYELEITFEDTDAKEKQRIVIDPDYVVRR